MEPFNTFVAATLLVIAAETTYITYRHTRSESKRRNTDIIVDTSVLMDGRIIHVAETGFIPGDLVVPRSVIGELQLLADTGDSEKRERARRGLDVLKRLQETDGVTVRILQDGSRANEGVDERLLKHAKSSGGSLATIDFNLNKVASVENIRVLNINELARNLRMSYLPGDKIRLDLTTGGSDGHQAVGHLDDGTMVVVEHAKKHIGSKVEIEIIRSLQTAAGRMMFARLANAQQPQGQLTQKKQQQQTADAQARSQQSKPKAKSGGRKVSTNQPAQATAQKPKRQTRRKSSTQREDSFIRLIDKQ